MCKAINLAKYVVTKCVTDNKPISNLQLQKILFYIQKCHLKKEQIAFYDDIEAWKFGPVVPNVYYRFCGYGAMPITIPYKNIDISPLDTELVNNCIEKHRDLSPWNLVNMTHVPGGAWDKTYNNGQGDGHIISLKLIKEED